MPVNEQLADEQWRRYTYCRDRSHLEFLAKADRCDQFFIGNQWLEQDMAELRDQKRPAMTINKILSILSTIFGEQIYNRTEVLFRPSSGSPAEVADALSKVWMQIGQNNQLPWVRSDVFADGCIRSRGFYDVRMDYRDSVFGEVNIALQNSKNVVIDPDAEEYDPDKWNDVSVTKWFTTQDIAVLYNEDDAELLKQRGPLNRFGYDSVDRLRDTFGGNAFLAGQGNWPYTGLDLTTFRNVRVLDRQYRKLDKVEHFVDITTGDMRQIPAGWDRERVAAFLERMGGNIAVTKKLIKRIRWTVTASDIVLHDDWSPYKHFTIVPYFPHFRYGKTVGLVENLLGPQEILNKVSSQELHIVNTTANSGWAVEEDSLVNMSIEELEAGGAKTGLVLEYKKNSQPPQKIVPNQPPSGLDRISMKAEEHMKTISNVSDSMMGFDRADVAAKAIQYKNQRGSINMSKVLDNLERTDFILARNVLDLVQEFYTDKRILNITKDDFTRENEQIVVNDVDPVTGEITNDLTLGEYSIVITSSPYRASLEDSQFEQARALREIGVQIPDAVLIENSRLLRRGEIVKQIEGNKNSPEAQEAMAFQKRAAEAEVSGKEATTQKTLSDAQLQQVRAEKETLEMQQGGDGGQGAIELAKIEMERERQRDEMALAREKMQEEMALAREKMQGELTIQREKMQGELELKEKQLAQQAEQQRQQQESARASELRGENT